VALVYDPRANEEGIFVWKNGQPQIEPFLVEADMPGEHDTRRVEKAKDVSTGAGATSPEFATLAQRLDAIERRQRIILTFLALIGVMALAWPLIVSAFLPNLLRPKEPLTPIPLQTDDTTSRPSR
jgi:hypothetical protein